MKNPNVILTGLVLAWLTLAPATYSEIRKPEEGWPKSTAKMVNADITRLSKQTTLDGLRKESYATVDRLTVEKLKAEEEKKALAQEKADLTRERDALTAEKAGLEQVKADLDAQVVQLQAEQARLTNSNTALKAENRALDSTRTELEKKKGELEAAKKELAAEIARQQTQHGTLLAENSRLSQETAQLQAEKSGLVAANAALRDDKQQLSGEKEKLSKDLDWESLLVKIFSGSTVTGILAVLGFMLSRKTIMLQNRRLEIENAALEAKLKGNQGG